MTTEEKKQKIKEFCDGHECYVVNGTRPMCPYLKNEYCMGYTVRSAPEEIIDRWYALFYGAEAPHIKDSGERQEFNTGAVRDIQKGKGRCDLMPLDVVAEYFTLYGDVNPIIMSIHSFQITGDYNVLFRVLDRFTERHWKNNRTMFLEVAKHFEEGAEKYGENNWQKGLPVKCYINSAVRHYLKWLRDDKDEPHDRAFCWNILCAIWTCKHKPELNDYAQQTTRQMPVTERDPDTVDYEEEND